MIANLSFFQHLSKHDEKMKVEVILDSLNIIINNNKNKDVLEKNKKTGRKIIRPEEINESLY